MSGRCVHFRGVLFLRAAGALLLLLAGVAVAQPPAGGEHTGPDSAAMTTDSLSAPTDSPSRATADSLAATRDTIPGPLDRLARLWSGLRPRRGMATPEPVTPPRRDPGFSPGTHWRPDSLRRGRSWPDRPADDFAEELLAFTPGPQLDRAQIGQRQFLALDGIDDREAGFSLQGEELHNRLDGRTDLSWLSGNLLDRTRTSLWQRLAPGRPGGQIDLSHREVGDSIEVQVDWLDGFLGLVNTEMVASRPLGRGGFQLGTRQVYTHERVPGAHAQENLFFGHWEHPLPGGWALRIDKRVRRHKGEVLDTGADRRIRQNLNRFRLWQQDGPRPWQWALDYQARWDRNAWEGTDRQLDDRGNFRRLELSTLGLRDSTRRQVSLAGWFENQRVLSTGFDRELRETGLKGAGRFPLSGSLELDASGRAGQRSDRDGPFWDLGLGLSGRRPVLALDWELLIQSGRRPPWADQLWLLRLPDERDEADSPWRRAEQARLLPNPDLADTRWNRREARLGWSGDWPLEGQGRLWLRAWQVRFSDQPAERPLDDGSGDHAWRSVDRLQNGLQLHASGTFQRQWTLHLSQAWLPESDEPLSREYPTYLADGSLGWQRRYFSRELELRLMLGLHHEYGAVDALGDPLWERPEVWLLAHAQRGRFTLWWSVRNLLGAQNARVEGRTLFGYEEILGVRWDFHD